MKKLRWGVETAAFLVFSFAVSLIPYRVGLWLGGVTGRLFFLLLKRRRKIAMDNIRASLPFLQEQPGWDPAHGTPETITKGVFENLGKCLVEDCRIYHGRGGGMIDAVRFEGLEHYESALAKGKGVAFITGHCGNWDLMALSFGARHRELSVVARRQDNAYLNMVLEKIRGGYGNRIIYKQGALRAMIGEFRKNNIVGVLVDQAVIPEDGILVKFLGRNCWATRLPVVLARKTGVPLIPVFGHREAENHVVQFFPEVQLGLEEGQEADSADMAHVFAPLEDYIARYPDQWYWIHNRWKRAPLS